MPARRPQGRAVPPIFSRRPAGAIRKSAPPPAAPRPLRGPGPLRPVTTVVAVFHKHDETTMTISIEQQVEELRAELRNAVVRAERRQIAAELAAAIAERDAMLADDADEPPR